MDFIAVGFGILLGIVIGVLFARVYWRQVEVVPQQQFNELNQEHARISERCKAAEEERARLQIALEQERSKCVEFVGAVAGLKSQIESHNSRLSTTQKEMEDLEIELKAEQQKVLAGAQELSSVESRYSALEAQLTGQKDYVEELKKQTKAEFENLANKIFDEKSRALSDQSKASISSILDPLKEKIKVFEEKVDKVYSDEAKERHTLKSEVAKLIELNGRMSEETANLTQALKGDSKVQGDWGEYILENILESAGLREGHEYLKQAQHEGEDGQKYKPDIILKLPDDKHLIIDCKVSLKAYEAYCGSGDEAVCAKMLKAHIDSMYTHVDDLADKHYQKLKGVNCPDFVFLFVPIEGAYLLAVQNDKELSMKAWKKGIAVVTSTTLFTSLRTVASVWKLDNQNKNAQEIATEAGRLYDKFVGFTEDFEKVGKQLNAARSVYDDAFSKLKEGPGNVFRKIDLLKQLGATPTKQIKKEYLEE